MDSPLDILGAILAFWYAVIPSYGLAIIGLTVVVRLALFPLTAKGVRSQRAMMELQPQIKQIQAKYRDDRQKLNEELLAFYKANRINPLSGCLPLLLQIPVFFGLFRVLNDPVRYLPEGSALVKSLCPAGIDACDSVAHIKFLSIDLQTSAREASGSFMEVLPYWILLGLVVLTSLYQGRQMAARQTNPNPQMVLITRIMPLMFGVFSISFPAGVVVYFLTSNLWQIGQQAIIYRTPLQPVTTDTGDASKENGKDDDPGSSTETGGPAKPSSGSEGGMRSMFARRLPGRQDDAPVDLAKDEIAAPPGNGAAAKTSPAAPTPAPTPSSTSSSTSSGGPQNPSSTSTGSRSSSQRSAQSGNSGSSGGQRPSGRASGSQNRSKKNRKRR